MPRIYKLAPLMRVHECKIKHGIEYFREDLIVGTNQALSAGLLPDNVAKDLGLVGDGALRVVKSYCNYHYFAYFAFYAGLADT